jgi:hypothetical protein
MTNHYRIFALTGPSSGIVVVRSVRALFILAHGGGVMSALGMSHVAFCVRVVYLYRTDNSPAGKRSDLSSFSCIRGKRYGRHCPFPHLSAPRAAVAVPARILAVALRPTCDGPDDTHACHIIPKALQRGHTVSWAPPQALLCDLRARGSGPRAPATSYTAAAACLPLWTAASGGYLCSVLPQSQW